MLIYVFPGCPCDEVCFIFSIDFQLFHHVPSILGLLRRISRDQPSLAASPCRKSCALASDAPEIWSHQVHRNIPNTKQVKLPQIRKTIRTDTQYDDIIMISSRCHGHLKVTVTYSTWSTWVGGHWNKFPNGSPVVPSPEVLWNSSLCRYARSMADVTCFSLLAFGCIWDHHDPSK